MLDRRRLILSVAGAALAGSASAQPAYPARTMTMVVPFPAGGPADLIGRVVKEEMEKRLGQPIVIDNRAGAGGTIGAAAVAAAAPDGHVVGMISTGAVTILPHLMTSLKYDPLRDLAPVGLALTTPQLLVVSPGLKVASVAELVALAKSKPGDLIYGSAGVGSSLHMAGELFRLRAGLQVTHLPYRGAAPALADLLGGRIHFMLADAPAFLSQVQSGALKALAVTARQRLAILPAVPTMPEAGLDVVSETWYGLLAPGKTPEDKLQRLHAVLAEALAVAGVRKTLEEQGGLISTLDRPGFAAYIRADFARWGEIVKAAGIKLDP
ncbi:Bug family tripartite tricarboxylate transporter substrate binding protein [Bosea sp. (in: a-proteobacteria)]|uniref:Bug family tripartite tricarboxylate transporter substrate binding protein n=1 Tax=Bosea sp. (in: a-proteobacteria) TaxID=1871050 RepID=UPI002FC9461B